MRKKILKDMLKGADPLIGAIQQLPHPDATETLALCGLDFLIFDLEHTAFDIAHALPCITMAAAYNIPMLIRVREKEQSLIEQALDAGAQGVLVPTVETVEECEMIVRASKFAPVGTRGWCNIDAAKRWMNSDDPDDFSPETFCVEANRDVFVMVLIETPLGIENLPEMLKVEGIDAFQIGQGDLSIRMGLPTWSSEVNDVVLNAINLIQDAGKYSCPLGLPQNVGPMTENGAKMFILGASERMLIKENLRGKLKEMRGIMADVSAATARAGFSVASG